MIGQVVQNFEILRQLGRGGMGAVFEARDQMLDRRVAIKVVRPELGADDELKRRFQKEAQALAKLHHPNITSVFSFFDDGNQLYLVMELVEGVSLQRRLRQGAAIPWREAVELAISALEGLSHAHHNGIVHRDVKPSNLMLKPGGGLKLMDFGISHILGQSRMTREGSVVGTLSYMAPEQITRREVDLRTDLYAMGVVLYEMVTGRTPFQAESDYELMRAQVERAPSPPRTFSPDLPAWLELQIVRALAKNPDHRPQSADQLADALRRGLAEGSGDGDTLETAPTQALISPALAAVGAPPTQDATLLTRTATQPSPEPAPEPATPPVAPTTQIAATDGGTLPPLPEVVPPLPPLPVRTKGNLRPLWVIAALVALLLAGWLLLLLFQSFSGPGGGEAGSSATTALYDPATDGISEDPTASPLGDDPSSDPDRPDGAASGEETFPETLPETRPPDRAHGGARDSSSTRPRPIVPSPTKEPRVTTGADVALRAHKGPAGSVPSPTVGGAPPPSTAARNPPAEAAGPGRRDPDQLLLDVGALARQLPDELEAFCGAWEEHLDTVENRETVKLNKADRQLEDQLGELLDGVVALRRAFNVVASREGLIEADGMLGRFRRMGSATRETVWQRVEEVLDSGRGSSELLGLAAATDPEIRDAWSPIQSQLYELERLERQAGVR